MYHFKNIILVDSAQEAIAEADALIIATEYSEFWNVNPEIFEHLKDKCIFDGRNILDKKEIDFDFNKRTKFIDVETGEELSTEPWHIRENYKRLMKERQKLFKKECNSQLIDYVPVLTNESLEKCIAEYLNKRKKLF